MVKKIGLLLNTEGVFSEKRLRAFIVEKKANFLAYSDKDLDERLIAEVFSKLPLMIQLELRDFSKKYVTAFRTDMKQKFPLRPADFYQDPMVVYGFCQHEFQLFRHLKPFFSAFNWYRRAILDGNHVKIEPFQFSDAATELIFEIVRNEDECYAFRAKVRIGEDVQDLSSFRRNGFFLEKAGLTFLLSLHDMQTLDKLNREVFLDENAFLPILAAIRKNYTVNSNHFFQTVIASPPDRRQVMLSELNEKFLMFTPRWVYQDVVVEGPWAPVITINKDGIACEIHRDKTAEQELWDYLRKLHTAFSNQHNGYFYLNFSEAAKNRWFQKIYYRLLQSDIEVLGMDMLKHFRYSSFPPETHFKVHQQSGGRIKLEIAVSFGKEKIPLSLIRKIIVNGENLLPLKDGSLGVLDEAWVNRFGVYFANGKIDAEGKSIEISYWMALTEQSFSGQQSVLRDVIPEKWWSRWLQWRDGSSLIAPLPETVNAKLRPYQQKGFEWMVLLSELGVGGCLSDEMGLGKTLQTICFLVYYIEKNPGLPVLIVCPASLMYNWQEELKKFAPCLKTRIFHGVKSTLLPPDDFDQILITSYGMVRSNLNLFTSLHIGVVVADESHTFKNPDAQISQSMQMLGGDLRIALSGTPVINNTFDLYAQFNFLIPGLFGSRYYFKKKYAYGIDKWLDRKSIDTLNRLTAPFILRRKKEDVAKDLPEKNEFFLHCRMGEQQRLLYNRIASQYGYSLSEQVKKEGVQHSKLMILKAIMRLRQLCDDPRLLPSEKNEGIMESVKLEMLLAKLTELTKDHKILIFSQFTGMLDLIAIACHNSGIDTFLLNGKTTVKRRAEMVKDFQSDDNGVPVFLISLKAGGVGLNLTKADYVFLVDPWWNEASEMQAIDRTHRIGQKKSVFVYRMICQDSIEEKIVELQQRKGQLSEELVAGSAGFMQHLSEQDINYLFSVDPD